MVSHLYTLPFCLQRHNSNRERQSSLDRPDVVKTTADLIISSSYGLVLDIFICIIYIFKTCSFCV